MWKICPCPCGVGHGSGGEAEDGKSPRKPRKAWRIASKDSRCPAEQRLPVDSGVTQQRNAWTCFMLFSAFSWWVSGQSFNVHVPPTLPTLSLEKLRTYTSVNRILEFYLAFPWSQGSYTGMPPPNNFDDFKRVWFNTPRKVMFIFIVSSDGFSLMWKNSKKLRIIKSCCGPQRIYPWASVWEPQSLSKGQSSPRRSTDSRGRGGGFSFCGANHKLGDFMMEASFLWVSVFWKKKKYP